MIAGTKLKSPILGPTKGLARKKVFRWEFPETRTISLNPRRCWALSCESECYGEWLSLQPRPPRRCCATCCRAPLTRTLYSSLCFVPRRHHTHHLYLYLQSTSTDTTLQTISNVSLYSFNIINTGIYCWSWYFKWFLSWRLHFMHLYKTDRTVFLPHNIKNFSLKVVIEIWVPTCQFINCSSIHLSTAGWFL